MKKRRNSVCSDCWLMIALTMLVALSASFAAENGIVTKTTDPVHPGFEVITITYATITDTETATFNISGYLQRIVVDPNDADVDGDIAISDMSGYNAVSLENELGLGDISYALAIVDVNGNSYRGIPMAGTHTVTLTNLAGAGTTTIYLYYEVEPQRKPNSIYGI